MNDEEWRPVEGHPYEISSLGRFRPTSWSRQNPTRRPQKPEIDKDGYVVYTSSEIGRKPKKLKAHILMCAAWHGPKPFDDAVVRHKDGSTNNSIDNLCWGTVKENNDDRELHGNTLRGEESPRANHTQEYIDRLRAEYNAVKAERQAIGKVRMPRGWLYDKAKETGIKYWQLVNLLTVNRSYHPK